MRSRHPLMARSTSPSSAPPTHWCRLPPTSRKSLAISSHSCPRASGSRSRSETMTTWVALLRGVNVGGITIRSADLASLFREELGFDEARTFLASGNVRFESDAGPGARDKLKGSIEKALRTRFGYDAWIVLVTLSEVRKAMEGFPFDASDGSRQPWVVFCVDTATRDELAAA